MVAQVRDFSKSRGDARFLLTILASYVNPHTGWAWPSLATLAHDTTKGKPYLLKLIRTLEALGELEVRRGRGRGHSNHYRIIIYHEPPPETPRKGNPSDDLLGGEKVIEGAEKVINGGRKGNPSGDPKENLRKKTPRKWRARKGHHPRGRRVDHAECDLWPASTLRRPPSTGDALL
jgi:hypothetical protein